MRGRFQFSTLVAALCAIGGALCSARAYAGQIQGCTPQKNMFINGTNTGPVGAPITGFLQLPDHSLVVIGTFTTWNDTPMRKIAKLKWDGSLDSTFATNSNLGFAGTDTPQALAFDGTRIWVVGTLTNYGGTARTNVAVLNQDGSLASITAPATITSLGFFNAIAIGGSSAYLGGAGSLTVPRLFKLDINTGTLDNTFDSALRPTGISGNINAIAYDMSSDSIVIGGNFTGVNGATRGKIARVSSTGAVDSGFASGAGFNSTVNTIALEQNGGPPNFYVGGSFTTFNGSGAIRIARLTNAGAFDSGFGTGSGFNNTVLSLDRQADGQILAAGSFTAYNGTNTKNIARINSDGMIDSSFANKFSTTSVFPSLNGIAWGLDNFIYIFGPFTTFQNTTAGSVTANGFVRMCP